LHSQLCAGLCGGGFSFGGSACAIGGSVMAPFLFRCPITGQTVQGWSADDVTDDDESYQSFECTACTRTHLVNLKTGKVLGEDED
jgi:hypothetical protein